MKLTIMCRWDGKDELGNLLQIGVYPYIISILTGETEKITKEGFITLLN